MTSATVEEQQAFEGIGDQGHSLSDLPKNIKAFWSMVSKTGRAQSIQQKRTDTSSEYPCVIHIDLRLTNSASLSALTTQIKKGVSRLYWGYDITIIDVKSAKGTLDRLFSGSDILANGSLQGSSVGMGVIISRGSSPVLKYMISILESSDSEYLL